MEINEFVRHFENAIFGIDPETLTQETRFREIDQWESITTLCLLSMIDTEYNVQIGEMDLNRCDTLRDLFNLVTSKKLIAVP